MKKTILTTSIVLVSLLSIGCEQKNSAIELNAYPKNGQCSIDVPAKNAEISATEDFHIGGWAFNKANNTVPDSLTIYFRNIKNNELVNISSQRGHKRPDVAKALNNPLLENSGFNALMEKEKLPQGNYEIILVQMSKESGAIICDNEPHIIKIK